MISLLARRIYSLKTSAQLTLKRSEELEFRFLRLAEIHPLRTLQMTYSTWYEMGRTEGGFRAMRDCERCMESYTSC